MTQEEKQTAIPKLRFSEFKNENKWTTESLGSLATIVNERVGDRECVPMSITSGVGLVSQIEKFGRIIAGDSYKNYVLIRKNDFAYNKSATKEYPEGFIAHYSGDEPAAVPNSIFTCFRINGDSPDPRYLNYLFLGNLHGRWLRKFIEVGARAHGSLSVKDDDLLALPIPLPVGKSSLAEQQKIAECLSTLDELIEAESRKLDALKDHKKGLMQQLFPREGETRPRLRFPEFRSSPDWTTRRMNEIYAFLANNSFSRDRLNYVSGSIKNIHYGDIHKHYRLLFDVTREVVPYINDDALTSESQPVFCAEGDIVFADASEDLEDIGKCIEIVNLNNERVVAGLHTILARPKTRSAFARGFSGYLFSSKRIRAQIQKESQGTKVLGISAKRLANIELCFPVHVAEQERIADCLSSLDDLIAAQSERLEALRAHKRGLMQQLFPNPSEFES